MAMNVSGKTAIITGAGSGINLAFATLLLSRQCNVVVADIALRPEAQEVYAQYSGKAAGKARAVFQKTDVTKWAELEAMFKRAEDEFGSADIVCPGAGVFEPPWSSFWYPPGTPESRDKTSESRYASFDINLNHPIRTTQLSLDHFYKHRKPGSVVLISSIAGQLPFFPATLYVAAKHAISGFARSLAPLEILPAAAGSATNGTGAPKETLPPVRVTAVAPGIIKTPIWSDAWKTALDEEKDAWIDPEDVAAVMVDLIEKEENVGGTILEVSKEVRKIEVFGDPGPVGREGNTVSNAGLKVGEIWGILTQRAGL